MTDIDRIMLLADEYASRKFVEGADGNAGYVEEAREALRAALAAGKDASPLAGSIGGGEQSADELHAAIMNISCIPFLSANISYQMGYKHGHRDARHAAAELACAHGIGALPGRQVAPEEDAVLKGAVRRSVKIVKPAGPDSQQPHVALPRDGGTDKLGGQP